MIIKLKDYLNEQYLSELKTYWMWITPDDKIVNVPKLNHKDYIMLKYKNSEFAYDYDKIFDIALKDGYVRAIYEYYPQNFKGELAINGYDKKRVKHVLKNIFEDLLRYGNKTVYVDYENPKESYYFSTFNDESKIKLINYMNR
jgi:hypothetical protein